MVWVEFDPSICRGGWAWGSWSNSDTWHPEATTNVVVWLCFTARNGGKRTQRTGPPCSLPGSLVAMCVVEEEEEGRQVGSGGSHHEENKRAAVGENPPFYFFPFSFFLVQFLQQLSSWSQMH